MLEDGNCPTSVKYCFYIQYDYKYAIEALKRIEIPSSFINVDYGMCGKRKPGACEIGLYLVSNVRGGNMANVSICGLFLQCKW